MTHRGSILLVDDEEKILKALGRALRDAGHGVVETTSPRHAQRLMGERTFDVVVVDNVMPELNGLDLIREFIASTPEGERPQILMMTAHATVESAIEAMKLGALDYLQKPFEIDELLVVVRRALDHQRLRTEYRYAHSPDKNDVPRVDRAIEYATYDREQIYVVTLFGRKCHYPDIVNSNPSIRAFNERAAINARLQGTAADIIRRAMVRMEAALAKQKLNAQMLLQVHDELVFEAPPEETQKLSAMVKHEMEQVYPLEVPLVADIGVGENWRDAK